MSILTPEGAGAYVAGKAASGARNVGRTAASARIVPGNRTYQPVILAEFLIAVVIVAVTPIATGGSPNAKAKNSPSPYDTGDLRQMVAVGAVYFLLSLASSGKYGRYAAWFGGLVLLGLLMLKLSGGQLGQVFTALGGGTGTDIADAGKSAGQKITGAVGAAGRVAKNAVTGQG